MFDISFSELLVIAIVALIVIGPEKLPKVARTAGAFFGRMQRFVAQVKDEVNRESRFAELQRLQEEVQSSLQQSYVDIEQSILSDATPATEAVEEAPVKKARKPRQSKAEELAAGLDIEAGDSKPRRRSAAATAKSKVEAVLTEPGTLSESTASSSAPARRARKSKPQPTTDLFAAQSDDQKRS